MKIVLVSHNKKKLSELRALFNKITPDKVEILCSSDIGFTEDVDECGTTFEENAYIKAKAIASLGYIAIADDSGLEVDALGGAPGIYSARYSGGSDADNNAKLLRKLDRVPPEKRTARFVCVIVCVFPDRDDYITVRGNCEGIILDSPEGDKGFGYDPLFYYEPLKKSFACLSSDEKNAVSHRGAAMRALAEALSPVFDDSAT